jgi:hypothetical protein
MLVENQKIRIDIGLPDIRLATAELSGKRDTRHLKYSLKLKLSCSSEIFGGSGRQYEANLKQCLVTLRTDGCMPDFSDAYNYTLPSKRKVTETDYSEVSKEKAGKLAFGATAVAKPDLMSRLLGKLSFSASRKEKSGAAIDGTAEFEQSVRLISYRGNHWVVGDDFRGDPSNEGSWLRGEYFYEDPIKPLCTVDLPDEDTMATVRIEVWARPGQIFIYDLDANGRPTYEAESRSRREALDIIEVNSGFRTRARLRGMVLAKALRAVRSEQLPLIDAKSLPPAYLLDCVAIQMPSFPIDSSH